MSSDVENANQNLSRRLRGLRRDHADQWAYASKSRSENSHLFQYPAMMVEEMQQDLLSVLSDMSETDGPVFDPFVGSGTVLGASMNLGLDMVGWDINPLAILISKVKSGPFHLASFKRSIDRIRVTYRVPESPEERFENWAHWFTDDVARSLTGLRFRIVDEPHLPARRFLWLVLAETVRLSSNSRTSTVKLHRRPAHQIGSRPNPAALFFEIAARNLRRLSTAAQALRDKDLVEAGRYAGKVELQLGDTRELEWSGIRSSVQVTSPPYGDNLTTVTYGQHAYLPLQWIDLEDIDPAADRSCLRTASEIDRRSLGGNQVIGGSEIENLCGISPSLRSTIEGLANEKPDRVKRVASFTRDLNVSLATIADTLAPGGVAAWTVGSRQVGGRPVPLEKILCELGENHDLNHVDTLRRVIPAHVKRMGTKNGIGKTMLEEQVVILRRARSS